MKKILGIGFMLIIMLLITGCGKTDNIVIYTSMEEERNQLLKQRLKEEFPELDVTVQYMATGNSAAKIKNEGTSIEADIIVDLETAYAEQLKENFADLSNFDTSIYLDGVNTSTKYLTWVKFSMGIIIDKKYFEENKLAKPKTYEDLLNPKYKNLIAMPDPKTSGTGYGFYLNVVNEKGEDNAIKYFKELKENLREFTTSGSGPINLLKQGETAIALGMIYQGVQAINEGYNFEVIELESGSPYNTTSIAIIEGRETNENVQKVFNWLINVYGKYDKENFLPGVILKNQENKINNYPNNITDANMKNVEKTDVKTNLIEKWEQVNG